MHACFKIQWILVQENIQNQILRKSTPLIKLGTQSKTKTKLKKKKKRKEKYRIWLQTLREINEIKMKKNKIKDLGDRIKRVGWRRRFGGGDRWDWRILRRRAWEGGRGSLRGCGRGHGHGRRW